MAIPSNITNQAKIVHFWRYRFETPMSVYGYNASSTTRDVRNRTTAVDYQQETTTFPPRPSPVNPQEWAAYRTKVIVAVAVPAVILAMLIWFVIYRCRQHRIRRSADEDAFRAMVDQFLADEAEEEEHRQANGLPLPPLDIETLQQIEVTNESDDICPTCRQTFAVGEMKMLLPCDHVAMRLA
ncbi:uncharacterized protein LOC129600967 [Paramacrobiotus metropolitanus]|uniref:uncharacterized protein LOC129600967 n=1 Tax=Paramacrobiotus metropolitanus TaxID=2943436 RepID=UPI002445ED5B|nr:uncharacterized protein LOC129600967 [Paramacrobiotus metropolitanus]